MTPTPNSRVNIAAVDHSRTAPAVRGAGINAAVSCGNKRAAFQREAAAAINSYSIFGRSLDSTGGIADLIIAADRRRTFSSAVLYGKRAAGH